MGKIHYLALSRVSGIGGATARKLIDKFGSLARAFDADDDELLSVPRITPDIVNALREVPLDALEDEIEMLDRENVRVLTWEDDDYPPNLLPLSDAPYLLYVAGDLLPEDERAVAVVGTREPSPQSIERAEMIAQALAESGVTVVSGLAIGIDTAAHRGALAARGGRTIAVLGSGLRMIHPRENSALAWEIAERGAVITEYHPNTPVKGPALMARDRIISGLSMAVVVVEAGLRSGSVDTAERARKQGRVVFAIPGSPGADALIASGATAVQQDDIDAIIAGMTASPEPPAEQPKEQLGLW